MSFFVVKVYASLRRVSYVEPWKKDPCKPISGTASLIIYNDKKFILTNEHVIRGNTEVHLTVEGNSKKFPVQVIYKNHSCDLALLEVTSGREIFEQLVEYMPLALDPPQRGTRLSTHGFPQGGHGYCTTEGSISRAESAPYIPSGVDLLRIQISAPINPGSSGGVALSEEPCRVLGVTSSGLFGGAQNVGYIIPSVIIVNFLTQYLRFAKNPYRSRTTFPGFLFSHQSLQQASLRTKYQLNESSVDEFGILITKIPEKSILNQGVEAGDIILGIDEYPVRSDGKINYLNAEISIQAYIAISKKTGDEVKIRVWRCDKSKSEFAEINVSIWLTQHYDDIDLFSHQPNKALSYYIHSDGAVFVVPDESFVYSYDSVMAAGSTVFRDTTGRPPALNKHLHNKKTLLQSQLVYLKSIMETSETLGVSISRGLVKSINGEEIYTLNQLAEMLEHLKEPAKIELESKDIIILSPTTNEKDKDFCEKQGIQQRMSQSVLDYLAMPKMIKENHKLMFEEIGQFDRRRLRHSMKKESPNVQDSQGLVMTNN
jgi:S1-C subfamily serine protease